MNLRCSAIFSTRSTYWIDQCLYRLGRQRVLVVESYGLISEFARTGARQNVPRATNRCQAGIGAWFHKDPKYEHPVSVGGGGHKEGEARHGWTVTIAYMHKYFHLLRRIRVGYELSYTTVV